MIIGIDGNEANVKEGVGVSVYAMRILEYFQSVSSPTLRFKVFLKDAPRSSLPKENEFFGYEIIGPSALWLKLALPLRLLKKDVDVFFSPAHYTPSTTIALVVTIHDLAYFYYPTEFLKRDLYKLRHWTRQSVKTSRKIIAVSKNTKKDLIHFCKVPGEKIEVIYNGFEKEKSALLQPTHYSLRPHKYILYVGTLQPRKNIATLIETYASFRQTHPDYKLVIAGKKGWLYDEIFALAKDLHLEEWVVFTGHVPDAELSWLYKNAFCFVYPSFYDGFGIVILEAMSFGCPVISSNASSLPEVGDDACLYFSPYKKDELLEHLTLLSENKTARDELIKKGRERVKAFSWERSAKETLDVIKKAVL